MNKHTKIEKIQAWRRDLEIYPVYRGRAEVLKRLNNISRHLKLYKVTDSNIDLLMKEAKRLHDECFAKCEQIAKEKEEAKKVKR